MARYPGAIWRPCPKHGYGADDTHHHQGVVIHSAEGGAAGLLAVLDDPNREASWHFHVNKDGTVYQPVGTTRIAWTNGSLEANQRFWGIENEGSTPEPLTEPQYQSLLALVKWLWATYKLGAPARQDNLWEHREMTRFGAPPTSCPGGRIPWTRLIADMEEDDMGMTPEEKVALADLAARVKALERSENPVQFGRDVVMTAAECFTAARAHALDSSKHGGSGGLTTEQVKAIIKATKLSP